MVKSYTHKDIVKNVFWLHDRGIKLSENDKKFTGKILSQDRITDYDFKKLVYIQLSMSRSYQSMHYPRYTP